MAIKNLTDLVGDENLADAFSDPRVNYSQDTPTKTRLPIPEECKGYAHPADINIFIERIYPNMRHFVSSKLPRGLDPSERETMVDEIINQFVTYQLGEAPTRNNAPRWTLYDPTYQQGKMPYYKYWLQQLSFFPRDFARRLNRDRQHFSLSEGDYEDTFENPANRAINIDTLEISQSEPSVIDDIALSQIQQHLSDLASRHAGAASFEANCLKLFNLKLLEEPTAKIASELKVSPSAVGLWSTKLQQIVRVFLDDFDRTSVINALRR